MKVIEGGGTKTATIARLRGGYKHSTYNVVFTGEGVDWDDIDAYNANTGNATQDYIPGFKSYLVHLDGGEEERLGLENFGKDES